MIDALFQDLRQAFRSARLNLSLTIVAVLTLGLGVSANIAMFQLFDVLRLRLLPVRSPTALVELRIDDMTHARGTWLRTPSVTHRLWEEVRKLEGPFSGVFAWADEQLDVASAGPAKRVGGLWVSGEFFQVLGVEPLLGRLLTPADDFRGCGSAGGVVISHAFWQREFGGDPSVIGKPAMFGKLRLDVLGVTPRGFLGVEIGRPFDVAMPVCAASSWFGTNARLDSGNLWWLTVMARLKPELTTAQAASYLQVESPGVFEAALPPGYPVASVQPYLDMKLVPVAAERGTSRLRDRYSSPLLVLFALTGLMLLVGCGNLAHLLLARVASRRQELSVRVALGASRLRLVQQLSVESALLTVAGVTTGLVMSPLLGRFLVDLLSTEGVPVALDVSVGPRTVAFAAFLSVVTCAGFAAVPVLRAARTEAGFQENLCERNSAPARKRTRRLLLASQIAMSLVLLAGASLFARTLHNLNSLDPGFQPGDAVVVDVTFSDAQQPSERNAVLRNDFLGQLRSARSVESVAEVLIVPLTSGNWNCRVWLDGSHPDQQRVVYRNMVGPGYFRTLNTRVIAGREFTEADSDASSLRPAIVNEALSTALGLGSDSIGRSFGSKQPRSNRERDTRSSALS
jgi:putative ABC transport system permease protein